MFRRIRNSMMRFLYGRYGNDRLNMFLLVCSLVLIIVSTILGFFSSPVVQTLRLIFHFLAYGLMLLYLFRSLSRNFAARQRENQWFLRKWLYVSDREHRYFRCPKCRQTVRVPRHRGKLCIRCPKCGEKFVKRT